jgi:MFS family permease
MASPSDGAPPQQADPGSRVALPVADRRSTWLSEVLAPLREANFCLLCSGQMISTAGDMFYAVALPWLVFSMGHTAQDLGIVLAAYGVPRVGALLLGGILSDRLRPRWIMLFSDVMRVLLVGLLVLLVVSGAADLWRLSLVAALLGLCAGLFLPAFYAITAEILPPELLQAGNALNTATLQLALFLGSALAGVAVSRLNPAGALLMDAATFAVSAMTLLCMRAGRGLPTVADAALRPAMQAEAAPRRFASDITFQQLLRDWRVLQVALFIIAVGNFLFNGAFEVALPTLAHDQLAAGAGGYGLLLAAFGAGSLLGGLGAAMLGRLPRRGIFLLTLLLCQACWYTFLPFAAGLAGAVVLLGCAGLTNSLLTVTAFTILQQQAPRHLLGRVMGMLLFASLGLYPFSVALAGLLTTRFGPALLFPLSGTMMVIAAVFGWLQREVRDL